jgi:hypothetical protein
MTSNIHLALARLASLSLCAVLSTSALAQTSAKPLDHPPAPAGDAKTVAQAAIKRSKVPCYEILQAERQPGGDITAVCKTPGKNPSHIYKDQTRYRIVGIKGGKPDQAAALTCSSSAQQMQLICK